jgi:23S rRNA (uracil1939-C5)-methyltransferase
MTEFSTFSKLNCKHFSFCSGCELKSNVSPPPIWQDIKNYFFSENFFSVDFISAEILGWRTRAKLAVRGNFDSPEIGLFKRGTHEVFSIFDCPLHHPSINAGIKQLRELIVIHKISPYNEKSLSGMLRYVQMVVERKTGKVQLALVINSFKNEKDLLPFVEQLSKDDLWHSIWLNFQPLATNRILGDQWHLEWGEPLLWEKLNHVDICFHPACFGQAHFSLFEKMLKSIRCFLLPSRKVVEFYAGVGAIGLSLIDLVGDLTCCEINPFAGFCFHDSVTKLSLELQGKATFKVGNAQECAFLIHEANVLIVDPPRKGLDKALLREICLSNHLEQIIYLSCGWESFKKDYEEIKGSGWKVENVEGYLFFPGSNHVEILASLKRA